MTNIMTSTRHQRGVGAIITGIIGATALTMTLLISFSTGILSDNTKLANQLAAAEADRDKASEMLLVTKSIALSEGDASNLKIRISNDGSAIAAYQYVLLYCLSSDGCASNAGAPIVNAASIVPAPPVALAPGEETVIQVGPVLDGLVYRVDVITERGNIVTTGECKVDSAKQICVILGMEVGDQ